MTEIFIHSLELGHSAATRAIKAAGGYCLSPRQRKAGAGLKKVEPGRRSYGGSWNLGKWILGRRDLGRQGVEVEPWHLWAGLKELSVWYRPWQQAAGH